MDLTQLRTFVAVAQEGHLTRAADRLHISQPAASNHIRALENHFGVQLFVRTNRNLELTTAGKQLAQSAQRVLSSTLELDSLARSFQGGLTGRLDLGTNADPALNRLAPLVTWMRERHPSIEMNLQVRSSLATKQGLRAGELDAGFLLGSMIEQGMSGMVLAPLEFRIAAPKAWQQRIETADWEALAHMPWVVTPQGTSNHEMREQLFHPRGLTLNIALEVNSELLLRAMIAEGIGIGFVRSDLALEGQAKEIYALSELGTGSTALLFLYSDARKADPMIQEVVRGLRSVWASNGSAA